jgi:hypothetical protein
MGRSPTIRKTLWIVAFALLFITIWTQFASAAELCPQAHAPDDYCTVCHLGVLPFLQVSTVTVAETPDRAVEWLAPVAESDPYYADYRAPGISRAPPLQS